ncbi:hypothetical protein PTNB73_06619 [Pyrenophora teres f. teres]|nr:hypothetical protein HRS9139_07381 [Pyrenophora teres f. teres]KAE8830760.1 hypothetical protein PTNB85_07347 [Pyrenophora teres f. teres]KAE8863412.1 hypothetical protein PTNB73_06619 [Pyrenophora teres f. teres]
MLLSTMLTTLLATLVIAYPDPTPQGYSGPCEVDNCGVSGSKCSAGRLCMYLIIGSVGIIWLVRQNGVVLPTEVHFKSPFPPPGQRTEQVQG